MSYNYVRPQGQRQAKIWNYYNNSDTWDWYRISIWPDYLAKAVIEERLNYKLRWQMFLYLVGNGKDPKIAVRDILEMGDSYFDREAIAHVENLPEAVANADGDYDYWDEHLKRIEPLTRKTRRQMVYEGLSEKRWKKQQAEMYEREYQDRVWEARVGYDIEKLREADFDIEKLREIERRMEEESDIEWEENPFIRKSRIIEQKGSVFALGMRYTLVHCIAQDAIMGAGIARKFREKYPDMQRYIRSKRPKIGEIVVYEAEDGRVIVNMVTKASSWDKPKREDFNKALITLVEWIEDESIKYVGMPKIGSGLDQLYWGITLDDIKTMLYNTNVTVIIREL